jgi:hypothetical protein
MAEPQRFYKGLPKRFAKSLGHVGGKVINHSRAAQSPFADRQLSRIYLLLGAFKTGLLDDEIHLSSRSLYVDTPKYGSAAEKALNDNGQLGLY